jgi:hypothetical protein
MPGQARGCPVRFLLYCAHGIDSTWFGTFCDDPDTSGDQCHAASEYGFSRGSEAYPVAGFRSLVEQHRADAGVRRFTTKSQLLALLYGQLSGASSLREIVAGLHSHEQRLYHVGARPAHRSTLADANAHRPPEVFSELFALMVGQANRHLRRVLGERVYLIDSTGLELDRRSADWARFSEAAGGAKVHVIYDPDADRPIYAVAYHRHGSERARHPVRREQAPIPTKCALAPTKPNAAAPAPRC